MHVKFTQTNSGKELDINVDLNAVNFNKGDRMLHIKGTTNLNYNNVRCIVDLDSNNQIINKTAQEHLVANKN